MERSYALLVRIALINLFLVTLAGSIVRISGSGMGCPDWPKCYDKWAPPLSADQLPANYKSIFLEKRKAKIERFAKLLTMLGFQGEAKLLLEDDSLLAEEDFSPTKAWTEYVNRLVGALAGLLVLACTIMAIRFYRHHPNWFWIAFGNLLLIMLTAWFGAVVVATNLMPWIITTHMLLAVALILNQVNLLTRVIRPRFRVNVSRSYRFLLFTSIALMLVQIILGTQVRQEIDVLGHTMGEDYRPYWLNFIGKTFFIHRSFSIALLLVTLWLMYLSAKNRYALSLLNLVFIMLLLEAGVGAIMNYMGMPIYAQPIHLMLGSVTIALQYYIFRRTQKR